MTTALERDLEACERAIGGDGPWEWHQDSDVTWWLWSRDLPDGGVIALEVIHPDNEPDADMRKAERAFNRWPAALRVVQAVMEMYGVHHLTKDVRDALRAFEDETT